MPIAGEIGLLCVMLAASLLPLPARVLVPTLSTAVVIGGLYWGRRAGTLYAVVADALELYAIGMPPAHDYTGYVLLLFPVIAGLIGGFAGRSLRRTRLEAVEAARHARILAVAVMELPTLDGQKAILRRLPVMLSDILGVSHADLLVPAPDGDGLAVEATFGWTAPPGVRLPLKSITGRALRTGLVQHVPDTERDPDFVPGSDMGLGRVRSELALPIEVNSRVVAVLNLERLELGAFSAIDVETMIGLARAAGAAIEKAEQLAHAAEQNRSQQFLLDLSRTIASIDDPRTLGTQSLGMLLERVGGDVGCMLIPGSTSIRVSSGSHDPGVPWPVIETYCRALSSACPGDASFFRLLNDQDPEALPVPAPPQVQTFAIQPLLGADGQSRAVFALFSLGNGRPLDVASQETLTRSAYRVGLALQRLQAQTHLSQLLEAIRGLLNLGHIEEVYARAAAAAETLVPGTDVAALLIPADSGMRVVGSPRYRASEAPYGNITSLEDCISWYGGSRMEFYAGRPHLRMGEDVPAVAQSQGVQASLCLPIINQGTFLALLNLESRSRSDAYHTDSVSLAETLALELGAIIQQAIYRQKLEVAAATDPLTGIGNRRSFDERLRAEWSEAMRYGHPLSLIVIDLQGFKSVNDRYGHPVGDAALVSITNAMNLVRRDGDSLFRWGGDEFAVILTHADIGASTAAAHRYYAALTGARTQTPDGDMVQVGANMGVASAPVDASSIEELLNCADQRVFRAKALHQPVEPASP